MVTPDELESELERFDIEVASPETCDVCGDELEPEQIAEVVKVEGEYKILCGKPRCLNEF